MSSEHPFRRLMGRRVGILLAGVLLVLVLDSAGSLAARALGTGYLPVGLAAYGLYLVVGGVSGFHVGVFWGAAVGAILAATHGSVGWFLAARLGPESVGVAFARSEPAAILGNMVVSGVLGGILGGVGGAIGRLSAKRLRKGRPRP